MKILAIIGGIYVLIRLLILFAEAMTPLDAGPTHDNPSRDTRS